MDATRRRAVLCILDGWGDAPAGPGNAVRSARTPALDALFSRYPHTLLDASGVAVGLPAGQQGNSEVGHLTIGSGRVVLQDLTRINAAIGEGSFFANPVLVDAVEKARLRGGTLHLMGLVSPGGVHSHQDHLVAMCELASRRGLEAVRVHAFTDGRDTPQTSGAEFLEDVQARLARIGVGRIASVGGRFYAMDRDQRWERLQPAYLTLVGRGDRATADAVAYLRESYRAGTTDEFILPAAVVAEGDQPAAIAPGDVVVHFNFRPDRAREICHALVDEEFAGFERGPRFPDIDLVTFADYDHTLEVKVAFPKPLVRHTLAGVVSDQGLKQFHVAETEKYAHVTYFINGGQERPMPGEDRLLVPSAKVATYDLLPVMSAAAITYAVVERLQRGDCALIVVNYANADMVGHTGNLAATVQAVEFLDACVGQVAHAAAQSGYLLLLTADHGNAEQMLGDDGRSPLTSHTSNQVPLLLTDESVALNGGGGLRDVAPTLLTWMGLDLPAEMSGASLMENR